jgi:hypothetical protein
VVAAPAAGAAIRGDEHHGAGVSASGTAGRGEHNGWCPLASSDILQGTPEMVEEQIAIFTAIHL